MEEQIINVDDYQIVKCYQDSDNDTIWRISQNNDTKNELVVHVTHQGGMYITFFPETQMSFKEKSKLIKTLCKHLVSEGYDLTIKIVSTNIELINVCLAIGFRYSNSGYKFNKSLKYAYPKKFVTLRFPVKKRKIQAIN